MSNSSAFAGLTRCELAVLVPDLLLIGQLIDRSGMAWVLAELGGEGMREVAIEEWMAASPIYTRRMQRALGFEGDDVVTIFKGLQLEIGAPPQFLDFRYEVTDPQHGRFWLPFCGALADVEPMGAEFVRLMCHDIEDPTFDATAVATNPRAQVRPVHRPPTSDPDGSDSDGSGPGGSGNACEWTVVIDDAHPPVSESAGCLALQNSRAATWELAPIVPGTGTGSGTGSGTVDDGGGRDDYTGPLLSDLDFADFSHAALVRIADEACLQMHLLNLAFGAAVRHRLPADTALEVIRNQAVGWAGIAARRLRMVLPDRDGEELLALHPMFNPAGYAGPAGPASSESPAAADGSWPALLSDTYDEPLQAIWREWDPTRAGEPEPRQVSVAAFSRGAAFQREHRTPLPIFGI